MALVDIAFAICVRGRGVPTAHIVQVCCQQLLPWPGQASAGLSPHRFPLRGPGLGEMPMLTGRGGCVQSDREGVGWELVWGPALAIVMENSSSL